jgi:hypothetical protein
MKKRFLQLCILSFLVCLSSTSVDAQIFKKKKNKADASESKKKKKKESSIKPYSEVITKEAKTDSGLFITHKMDTDYFFEIPMDLLEKEMLIVSRISGFVKNLNFGGAGVKSKPQQVIRWQRKDDKIILRSVSYNSVANFDEPIYQSVKNNNFEPIIEVFDIKAFNKDSTSIVFIANSLFESDVEMIGPMSSSQRKNFGIRSLVKDKSFINNIKSYPKNIEVRHVMTYTGSKLPDNQVTGTLSVEMNQSIIMLPEEPWIKRNYDDRVGYFSVRQTDYSSDAHRADSKRYITRWRLEPKDWDAYNRGELVEPVKPIVYYVDPATPERWKPYIKQGVNDWQKAFEKAGFKNAIYALDPPTPEEDPEWSAEDVRYSVIRYVSTDIQNAMGPHVHDPRTGEIIESDIIWYHNILKLLRNWYFIQTAAVNPEAQKVKFRDEIMGECVRFVSAHEVGHTLGLPHNMGASVAYPIDSLRSPSFTKSMGTSPSIMDYARFNYVAQPEDGDVSLTPGIGPYDDWSIEYGYRLTSDKDNPAEDSKLTNDWIKEKAGNPLFRYGRQQGRVIDPSSQTEDLGADAVEASELGLKNLKRIVPNLITWSYEEGQNYDQLEELYNALVGQFRRYIGHVGNNIGGVYEMYKTADQQEPIYSHVTKEKQKEAMNFISENVLDTPDWLLDKAILDRITNNGAFDPINGLQSTALRVLLSASRIDRMTENELVNGSNVYTVNEMFNDLEANIFKDVNNDNVTIPRKNLHRLYVDRLEEILESDEENDRHTELTAHAFASLQKLKNKLNSPGVHAIAMKARIEKLLD